MGLIEKYGTNRESVTLQVKGAARESLSNARDLEKLSQRYSVLSDENEELRREVKAVVDAESNLRLQFHKLLKEFEKETASLHKTKQLASQKTHEFKQFKRASESQRGALVAQLQQAQQKIVQLTDDSNQLQRRLGTESAALRNKTTAFDKLDAEHEELIKDANRMKNDLIVAEGRINTLEHASDLGNEARLKLEVRSRKLKEELKAVRERHAGETVRANQAFSEMVCSPCG
eukprot:SAG31_NODE_296_length_18227_cov_39.663173_15_plen_232_part_00